MKRDLIYLFLIVAAIAAAKVTAQTTPETPAEIRPQHIEAGFTKTVHILFPSPVTYIDIGSMDIIAGKADGAENVVRVKAAVRNFAAETNLTVITEDGGFFTFDVYYAENPAVSTLNLTVQEPQPESMKKPAAVGYPQPTAPASESRVLLREVGREKPATVKRMLSDIYRQNRTDVKGIRTKKYGIGVEVLPAVAKRIGRHVEDAHDARTVKAELVLSAPPCLAVVRHEHPPKMPTPPSLGSWRRGRFALSLSIVSAHTG